MRRFLATIAIIALSTTYSPAQEQAIKPINVPMSFSGNYGELRHDHFHQGADWRVGGKVGDPIHSIKSGYIAHVSVSNTGYGNAVYINHPDGTTSVYGHMLCFRDDIAQRVKSEQYARESFSVSLDFTPEDFPLKQGEIFGKVGNTGSSGGPHLHMEVRNTEENLPINYFSTGYYSPLDNLAPHFRRTFFYGLDTSLTVPEPYKVASIYSPLTFRKTLSLPAVSYVAIDAYDIQNGTTGKLAVEEYAVYLDNNLLFKFKIGDISHAEGRYLPSLVQQGEGGADLVKSWISPGNILTNKTVTDNDGLILLEDYNLHNLRLEAYDLYGNRSIIKFQIRRDDTIEPQYMHVKDTTASHSSCLWYMPEFFENEEFSFTLPAGALTGSANITYRKIAPSDTLNGIWSEVWSISSPNTALMKSGTIRFKCNVPQNLADKAYVARYFKGSVSYNGPHVGFGAYCLATDTEAPVIEKDKRGRIVVKDSRSGVASVRFELDGKWHLFKYFRGIVTILDRESISKGQHKIKITATDRCGNSNEYSATMKF